MSSPHLSAQALKEMALGTKSIALIAASRRCKVHDKEGSCLDSRDPSPADWRWPHASPSRDHSLERKAGRKRSPSLTWSLQQVRKCLSGCWGVAGMAEGEGREGRGTVMLLHAFQVPVVEVEEKCPPQPISPGPGLAHDPKPQCTLVFCAVISLAIQVCDLRIFMCHISIKYLPFFFLSFLFSFCGTRDRT